MNKPELIAGMQKEYQGWQELLDQIGLEHMDEPSVAGHWSIKDIGAHLTGWRRRTVARLQAAGLGDLELPPPWPSHLQTDDEINAWIYETNHARPVQEILDESNQVFLKLLSAIEGLPDQAFTDVQRYLPWWEGSFLNPDAFFAHFHEEHEADMRAWLAKIKKQ
jgi:hypothetical protein